MGSEVVVVLAVALVLLLLAARVPVAWALAAGGAIGLYFLEGPGITNSMLARQPFRIVSQFSLIIVPMFIAMGMFARQSRIAEDTFRLAARWVRGVPGGLAVASILACAGFAAVSGSSVATVVTVGRIAIDEMRRYGYDAKLAMGVVGAAGTLGVLIPPSVVLVLYGIITNESIGRLLIAGIVPGVLSAVLYALAIIVRVKRNPRLVQAVTEPSSGSPASTVGAKANPRLAAGRDRTADPRPSYVGVVQIAGLFLIVVGGIYSGLFTATESAALGALVALLILVFDRGAGQGGAWNRLRPAFKDTVATTSMAFALLIGAGIFTFFIVVAGVPQQFTSWVIGLEIAPLLVVILLLLAFIPLGMMLDPLSILLIAVPLSYPVVTALGFDGIWFGIVVVKMIELGLITPPVGINVFLVAGITEGATVEDAFRGIMWFFPVDLLTVGLLIAFPQLVTWLPALMRG